MTPRVRVLGSVGVAGVEISALLERRLLALLVMHRSRPIRIDALADALWAGYPPPAAANSLMSKVSRLRSALGRDRIVRNADGFRLVLGDAECDVDLFESCARAAFEDDSVASLTAADDALQLWRGEPFGEFATDEFAYAEAVRLTRLHESAAERRVELLFRHGHLAEALVGAEHLLVSIPASERLCAVQAGCLEKLGRPADALRAIHVFRERLLDDFGVSIGAELTAVEAALLDATAGGFGEERPITALQPGPVVMLPHSPARALIGRSAELEHLRVSLDSSRFVTVTGEAGIGKSRLALTLSESLAASGHGVIWLDASTASSVDGVLWSLGASDRLTGEELWADAIARLTGVSLLVLDGCDRDTAVWRDLLSRLLAATAVMVLVTSRQRLDLSGETVVRVDPLPSTEPGSAAAQLLTQICRERAVEISADVAEEIARQLDGLPLAIELVGARLAELPPAVVAAELGAPRNRLELTAGRIDRGLSREILTTCDRLSFNARQCFTTLSYFPGGASFELTQSVATGLGVGSVLAPILELVDSGLVRVEPSRSSQRRYRLLSPIADVGRALAHRTGSERDLPRRFADTIVEFAESSRCTDRGNDEGERASALAEELVNIRAAYRWCVEEAEWGMAARLVAALQDEAVLRERAEIEGWAIQLSDNPEVVASRWGAVILGLVANASLVRGDFPRAHQTAVLARRRMADGADPTWTVHSVSYLLAAMDEIGRTGTLRREPSRHVAELEAYTSRTGDPIGAALAAYDEAYVRAAGGIPGEGLAPSIRLLRLGRQTASPLIRSMGLFAVANCRAAVNPERAMEQAAESAVLAGQAKCSMMQRNADRLQLEIAGTLRATSNTDLADAIARVAAARRRGHREQTLQELTSLVTALCRLSRFEEAAYLWGGLDRTLWTLSNRMQADRIRLTESMGRAAFERAARPGRRCSWDDLAAYAEDLTDR